MPIFPCREFFFPHIASQLKFLVKYMNCYVEVKLYYLMECMNSYAKVKNKYIVKCVKIARK